MPQNQTQQFLKHLKTEWDRWSKEDRTPLEDFTNACGQTKDKMKAFIDGSEEASGLVLHNCAKNLYKKIYEGLVTPLMEIEEIPRNNDGNLKQSKIPDGKGIYVLYDSDGIVLYIGMTGNNFKTEVNQTLKKDLAKKIPKKYFGTKKGGLKKKEIVLKDVAHHISLYRVDASPTKMNKSSSKKKPIAIHNLEALLLHIFMNQAPYNDHLEKFITYNRGTGEWESKNS